jgi:hypothetical protein
MKPRVLRAAEFATAHQALIEANSDTQGIAEHSGHATGATMAENKTKPTRVSVSTFIDVVESETRRADARTLVKLMKDASGEPAVMWGPSIIGFGSYHYVYDSGREGDMPLVGFSPRKAAIVLYVHTSFPGGDALLVKLGKHTGSKACLYVKKLDDVDQAVLKTLVSKSVAAMRKKYAKAK